MILPTTSFIGLARQILDRTKQNPAPKKPKPQLDTTHANPSLFCPMNWDDEPSWTCNNPHEQTDET